MPSKIPLWQKWEEKVNTALGLRPTYASGNHYTDIGDGVTPDGHPIQFITDAKSTEKKSYSINAAFMADWEQRAAEQGKMFGLPVRFETTDQEYMVITFEDFQTLWWLSKKYLEEN